MSHLLQRLAARSLGVLPALQPRRASRFETMDSAPILEEHVERVAPSITSARRTAPIESTNGIPRPRMGSASLPNEAEPSRRERNVGDQVPILAPKPKALFPAWPEPPLLKSVPEPLAPPAQPPLLRAAEPEIHLQPIPMPISVETTQSERTVIERRIHDVQPLLIEPRVNESILPQLAPQARPNPMTATPAPARAEREDVHISIGRIEIRALPAPVAHQPRRPVETVPSTLDRYLQQRGRRTS